MKRLGYLLIFILVLSASFTKEKTPVPGAMLFSKYRQYIEGKSVAIVANQTSMAGEKHLVDLLVDEGFNIKVIFAPEHGFRELADAGDSIADGKDAGTGVKIISLYGKHIKPTAEDLAGIDVVLFDIQDVGVRFYTYISTLHYLMEACAENNVTCVILDRPNPNGFYVDGNILDTAGRSFVGMHPVPIVHGMTTGEYAQMINGEGWLKGGVTCDLKVVRCKNYDHDTFYDLPVRPSPNLPNQTSVYLYPSLCLFEGTNVSVGRGTPFPFQAFGSPLLPDKGFSFTPESTPGARKPPLLGVRCYGTDLRNAIKDKIVPHRGIILEWLVDTYNAYPEKDKFFNNFFDVLAGSSILRQQIQNGMDVREIKLTWEGGLDDFRKMRKKYLLYR